MAAIALIGCLNLRIALKIKEYKPRYGRKSGLSCILSVFFFEGGAIKKMQRNIFMAQYFYDLFI